VRASGRVAKSYLESMPGNCVVDSAGRYAVKHNPAAYYVGGDDRAACQQDNVPLDQFAVDLAGELPALALIVPDICNSMHDCPVATGDAWLRRTVQPILDSAVYRQGRTALFVAFDESQGGGTIPFIAVSPSLTPGTVFADELDHYALLRTTEDMLGIPEHLGAAATAASIPI
jgi:phospholipase C